MAARKPHHQFAPASRALGLVSLASLLTACIPGYDACFDPPATIRSPQVLAVRADPPEAVYQPGDPAPTVRLRVLLARPTADSAQVEVTVRLCPPNLQARCDDAVAPATSFTADSDHIDAPGLRVPPEVIAQALAADALRGYGGTRVLADLFIRWVDGEPQAPLRAGKLLLFSPHGTPVNGPIDLDGVLVTGRAREPRTVGPGESLEVSLPDSARYPADRDDILGLRPLLRAGSIEEYDTTDLTGRAVHLLDNVSYEFRATSHFYFGNPPQADQAVGFSSWADVVGGDVAAEPLPGTTPPANGLVQLRAMKVSGGRIFIVARDTRGAEAWLTLGVYSNETRCCKCGACFQLLEPLCDFAPTVVGQTP